MGAWWSLGLFAFVATISPGGATALVASSGTRFGYRGSLPLMSGVCLGMGVLMAAVSIGLGSVVGSSSAITLAMRIAGSAYLLVLAWVIARQGAPDLDADVEPLGFAAGLVIVWVNPKVWSLGAAAVASFADTADSTLALAAALGVAFVVVGGVSASAWCVLGSWVARTLGSDRQWVWFNRSLALLLVASTLQLWR